MSVTPEQLRYHADRSEARGRHATAIFCRDAADEIERLRDLLNKTAADDAEDREIRRVTYFDHDDKEG